MKPVKESQSMFELTNLRENFLIIANKDRKFSLFINLDRVKLS